MRSLQKHALQLGFWTLADQGAVSLGNFLTQVILARNLARIEYGVFALLFGVLIILYTCHLSLVSYPLTVRGAFADRAGLKRLTSASLLLTLALNVPFAAAVLGASVILGRPRLAPWLAAALLFWLLQETTRRGLLAHLRHSAAVWGDGLSYLGQAGLMWALAHRGHRSLPTAFAVIALTSGIAGLAQAFQLGIVRVRFREALSHVRAFWQLGRWSLLAYATDSTTAQAFPWGLSLLYGPQEAAPFQAILNVLGVSHPVIFSSGNLIVPAATRAHRDGGIKAALRSALKYGIPATALLLPYYALLVIWPRAALGALYGKGSVYLGYGTALRTLVVSYLFGYVFHVLAAFLSGVERPRSVFVAELGGAGAALALGVPLTIRFRVTGACAGFLAMTFARSAVGALLLRKLPGLGKKAQVSSRDVPLMRETKRGIDEAWSSPAEIGYVSAKPSSVSSEPEQ